MLADCTSQDSCAHCYQAKAAPARGGDCVAYKALSGWTRKAAGVALALIFTGCAQWPADSGDEPEAAPVAESAAPPAAPAKAVAPARPLSPELVYAYLLGEVAVQRGDKQLASRQYLQAAEMSADAQTAKRALQVALAAGDQDTAWKALRIWLHLEPQAEDPLRMALFMALKERRFDLALGYLRQLVVNYSAPASERYHNIARFLMKSADAAQSLQLMETLYREQRQPDALFALAQVALHAGNIARAEQAVDDVLRERSDWIEAHTLKSRILIAQKRDAAARVYLEGLLPQFPDAHPLREAYARLLVDLSEYSEAYQQFSLLVEAKPDEAALRLALAAVAEQLQRYDIAEQHFRYLWERDQFRDLTSLHLGMVAEAREHWDDALNWYSKVQGGQQFDAQLKIASVYLRQGNSKSAREALQQLRSNHPRQASSLHAVEADLLRQYHFYAEAQSVYDQALEAEPGNTQLLYGRGLNGLNLGRVDWLERDMLRVIAVDADNADALNALGYTLADRTNRLSEAQSYIERAMRLQPDSPAVLDSMGWVLYRQGKLEESRQFLQRAMSLNSDAEIASHLGEVLWMLGARVQAWDTWNEALAREPGNDYLLRTMERFRSQSAP